MIRLKIPPIERISGYKTYGNKYMKFWRNTITSEKYIVAVVCGEKKTFPETQEGVEEMGKWINEKRAEIATGLLLCEEDKNETSQSEN